MAKQVVGGVSGATLGMLAYLILKLKSGGITERELERFTNRQDPFGTVENYLVEWRRFYSSEVFGIQADLSGIRIPPERKGFGWLVVMLKGMTAQKLFDKCAERFKVWKYTGQNLDNIITSDRTSANTYAVFFRDRVEADEELKNKSANDLKSANILGITIEERFLWELFYYWKTKKHLDMKNTTLCFGSRYLDGGVPDVDWGSDCDRLRVSWCPPDDLDGSVRGREAVSLP